MELTNLFLDFSSTDHITGDFYTAKHRPNEEHHILDGQYLG